MIAPDTVNSLNPNIFITAYYQNVRGVNGIINELFLQLLITHYDIIAFTETYLKMHVDSNEIFPSDKFDTYRCDRLGKAGGGVCIAIRNPSRYKILPNNFNVLTRTYSQIDIVGIDLKFSSNSISTIIVIYIPPQVGSDYFELFLIDLAVYLFNKTNIIIMGDFNVRSYVSHDLNNNKCRALNEFFNGLDIVQVNNIRNCDNVLLDLVALSSSLNCRVNRDNYPLTKNEDKYHPPLSIELEFVVSKTKCFHPNRSSRGYNYRKANLPALYNAIQCAEWDKVQESENINTMCDVFYAILYKILDENVPLRKVMKSTYPAWYNMEIITTIKNKFKFHSRYKRYKRQDDLDEFQRLRHLSKSLIQLAFKDFLSSAEININKHPEYIWRFIHTKERRTRIPGVMNHNGFSIDSPQEIVEAFSNYFSSVYLPRSNILSSSNDNPFSPNISVEHVTVNHVKSVIMEMNACSSVGHDEIPYFLVRECAETLAYPLAAIFNKSIGKSEFPTIWKTARVVPIHKSADKSTISNYRPISLLSIFAKIFEKLLCKQIYPQIKQYISPFQHGFMPKRSTATNLATLTDFIASSLDCQGQVDVVYTDLSKAFDRIDIGILTGKLRSFGFHDNTLKLINSYLVDRIQYVFYNGVQSSIYKATSGVPQGSNLGPLLFAIFINDLPNFICSDTLMFADDVKLYRRIANFNDCLNLQQDLTQLCKWCVANKLDLNVNKCKILSYTRKYSYPKFEYTINNNILERVDSVIDLGVVFTKDLNFKNHISITSDKAIKKLGFVIRNCKEFKNTSALKRIYTSLVRPLLEYATVVWSPSSSGSIVTLENVQRRFMKYLHHRSTGNYPPRGYPNDLLLQETQLDALELRREYFDAMFIINITNGNIDSSLILQQINFRIPRSSSSRNQHLFYLEKNSKRVKQDSPFTRICRTLNGVSEQVDLSSVTKKDVRRLFLRH